MMLKDNSEVIGDCKNITIADGKITFDLAFNRQVEVPQSAFEDTDLKDYVGDRVGIIHFGGVYRIRKISKSSNQEKDEHLGRK
jgi:hypothetical protein